MKQQIAKLNYLRIAPRKVRLMASLLRGMSVNEAEAQLITNSKRSSEPLLQLLRSAISNAKNNQMNLEKLIVKEIRVDGGPMLKRWLPRAQGRATPIQKKSSHISIILEESEKARVPRFKIEKQERVKKSQLSKIKKEQSAHKHDHEHIHDHDHENENRKKEDIKEIKEAPKKGFAQRMFRRKSIG
ncbi:50S ribosomal protein L22 [Candidatus Wolfebacteria bacterium CG10_big_fil_rev_8_21_14_0_10_31_9]|uniref:Large ribosomal subunit protein uL22 n=1 Tax=Candidatus Wolfebacteria bacterium CG10_big_fil_rev_8_21_14_0_10_31_9 TaxID=1975070 RepID=A0A2H0RCE1_9BACT|nr:MAG: 50S ribosomal protein L22 [Candidatus Wolfebacteria bacterium CG10_big_fil_rev_8_21_14_0_10_31_9]